MYNVKKFPVSIRCTQCEQTRRCAVFEFANVYGDGQKRAYLCAPCAARLVVELQQALVGERMARSALLPVTPAQGAFQLACDQLVAAAMKLPMDTVPEALRTAIHNVNVQANAVLAMASAEEVFAL